MSRLSATLIVWARDLDGSDKGGSSEWERIGQI